MTKEKALNIEIKFLKSGCSNHIEFSNLNGKSDFWYLNLAKKYNLKISNKIIIKKDKTKTKIDINKLKEVTIKEKSKREQKREKKQNPLLWNFREKISKLKGK